MFFTCKNFMFSDFTCEKKNAAGNAEGAGAPLSPFPYGPVCKVVLKVCVR